MQELCDMFDERDCVFLAVDQQLEAEIRSIWPSVAELIDAIEREVEPGIRLLITGSAKLMRRADALEFMIRFRRQLTFPAPVRRHLVPRDVLSRPGNLRDRHLVHRLERHRPSED
ncbi:hypothetical protein [Phycisphaera mikurensis]|uniref:hypothetical protein n=1 Tax=Phycisphaera mikurensis TaxID=547188 RepID=UPI0012B552C2|nr:hypothetical protein [Phycisphaera mikurensis]MBB6443377.1 hypothetical protein [Phycisphaera mikurensis]